MGRPATPALLDQFGRSGRSVVKHCGTTGGQSRRFFDSRVAPSVFDEPYLSHGWLLIVGGGNVTFQPRR